MECLRKKERRRRREKKETIRVSRRGEETIRDTRLPELPATHSAELIRLMTSWIRRSTVTKTWPRYDLKKFLILMYIYIYIWVDDINRNSLLSRTDYWSEKPFLASHRYLRGSIPEWFIPVMRSTRLRDMATNVTSINPVADQREFGRDKWFFCAHKCHVSWLV